MWTSVRRDEDRVHIWVEDGYDGWDETSWADGRKRPSVPPSTPGENASGVGLRQDIADAYVMMRLAELVCEQRISAVAESAVSTFGGNGGCLALQRLAPALVSALEPIGSEAAAAEVRKLWNQAFGE